MRFVSTLIAVMLCGCAVPAIAQTPDSVLEARMTRRALSCDDIVLNASMLLPRYHAAGYQDSVEAVLAFVERRCKYQAGLITHYSTLYGIDTSGHFEGNSSTYTETFSLLRDYYYLWRPDSNSADDYVFWFKPASALADRDEAYLPFLKSYGATLASRTDLSPAALWIARYYASGGDTSLLSELDNDIYTGTSLQRERRAYRRMRRAQNTILYGTAIGGVWAPQGALSIVGPKTLIGMELGGMTPNVTYTFSFYGMVGRSRLPYTTEYRGTELETDYFSGIGVGLRGEYAVLKTGKLETNIGAGAGYESVTLVKDETPDDDEDDSKDLGTLNVNAGLSLNYYFWEDVFAGAFARYHLVDYKNNMGTSFSGNAWTVGISLGVGNYVRRVRTGKD